MMQFTLARTRTSICLGQELGRGGEGAVFAIDGQNDRVAKIYSVQPDAGKIQKLTTMTEAASPLLLRIAAWPVDLRKLAFECPARKGGDEKCVLPEAAIIR